MSPSGAEVIKKIKERIHEIDPAEVREGLANGVPAAGWFGAGVGLGGAPSTWRARGARPLASAFRVAGV